jgi:hypothetical protein
MEPKLTHDLQANCWPQKMRRADAARYLREVHGIPVQPSTLAKWHSMRSDGPPAHHAGRVPLYPKIELDDWAQKRLGPLRSSTSDTLVAA